MSRQRNLALNKARDHNFNVMAHIPRLGLSFFSSFVHPELDFLSNSAGVSRKVEDAYPAGAPGPCSQFIVESELLIRFALCV